MAIKGKKRTRGRPRAVAHAPRPFLVPPKTPLFRRRGVQIVLIAFVWGIFALLGWGLRASQDAGRHREEVTDFSTQLESAMAASGVATVTPGGPVILPEMAQIAAALKEGERPGGLAQQVGRWRTSALEAADAVAAIDSDRAELQRVRGEIASSLRLYAVLAKQIRVASLLDGPSQRQLLSAIDDQLLLAAGMFDEGWRLLLAERRRVGISDPAPQSGLPPGGGLPPGFEFPPGEVPEP